jgi:hypothetical protein
VLFTRAFSTMHGAWRQEARRECLEPRRQEIVEASEEGSSK